MNPFDELFSIGNGLLTGITTDVSTLFSAIIVIGFICVGIDYLRAGFESSMQSRNRDAYMSRSKELYDELYPNGNFDRFEKKRRMNRYLNKVHKEY